MLPVGSNHCLIQKLGLYEPFDPDMASVSLKYRNQLYSTMCDGEHVQRLEEEIEDLGEEVEHQRGLVDERNEEIQRLKKRVEDLEEELNSRI